jgi:LysR family transcriptional regulator, chromosome initiation inhibitor
MSLLDKRIEAFFKVARSGTVQGAGKALGLTQTAITQRIRSLEEDLRVTLFTRSRKGMKLTPEGLALFQYCKGAEELEGAVFSRLIADDPTREAHVTIAAPTSAMSYHFVRQSTEVMKTYPGLFVHMMIDDLVDRVDLIRKGTAQLALVAPDQVPKEMDSKKLRSNRYILVCTSEWRGRDLREIISKERIIDFYESDRTTLNYLEKHGLGSFVGRQRLFVNHNLAMIELLLAGTGFGTLTQDIAKPYLESGELIVLNRGNFFEEPMALIWYPRPQMPKYFKAVIAAVR